MYGAFVFITVYSYTELMDGKRFSLFWETLRLAFAVGVLWFYGGWFGLQTVVPFGNYAVLGYLIVSLLVNAYFVSTEFKPNLSVSR